MKERREGTGRLMSGSVSLRSSFTLHRFSSLMLGSASFHSSFTVPFVTRSEPWSDGGMTGEKSGGNGGPVVGSSARHLVVLSLRSLLHLSPPHFVWPSPSFVCSPASSSLPFPSLLSPSLISYVTLVTQFLRPFVSRSTS